jgi:hypothetical protein
MLKAHEAHVKNGRLVMNEPTDLPEGTTVELVSIVDVLANGGDVMDNEDRAVLDADLEASFTEEAAGQLLELPEALADLRSRHGRCK